MNADWRGKLDEDVRVMLGLQENAACSGRELHIMTADEMVGPVRENREPGSPVLYTVGYEGRSPEEFCTLLRSCGIVRLVDVRQVPNSRKAGFALRSLSRHLGVHGIEYVHLGELGSPKDARTELHRTGNFESFAVAYLRHMSGAEEHLDKLAELAAEKPTAIMCFEKDVSRCHRGIVAGKMGDRGFEIRDL